MLDKTMLLDKKGAFNIYIWVSPAINVFTTMKTMTLLLYLL